MIGLPERTSGNGAVPKRERFKSFLLAVRYLGFACARGIRFKGEGETVRRGPSGDGLGFAPITGRGKDGCMGDYYIIAIMNTALGKKRRDRRYAAVTGHWIMTVWHAPTLPVRASTATCIARAKCIRHTGPGAREAETAA